MLRHDGHHRPRIDKIGVRCHVKAHGEGVDHLHGTRTRFYERPPDIVWKSGLRVGGSFERIGHVVGVGKLAIVPIHVVPEVESELPAVVRHAPGLGQVRRRNQVRIIPDERHEVEEDLDLQALVRSGDVRVHATWQLTRQAHHHHAPMLFRRRCLPLEPTHELRDTGRNLLTEGNAGSRLHHPGVQAPGPGPAPVTARARPHDREHQDRPDPTNSSHGSSATWALLTAPRPPG